MLQNIVAKLCNFVAIWAGLFCCRWGDIGFWVKKVDNRVVML